ncbi:site-specific integrase [Rhodococcus erythropolis]|uniref:tyrosine-type recombinase/integrase n=1 Tax=Rhodococcus erythropolis TaxID=1833 RepID=UPI00210A5740|nr:tyrosine-type recombinase/integrase [Rhodococcus erythropolis]MCQ4129043.1 site-specific integrase [Rhodococcus erythropolis]
MFQRRRCPRNTAISPSTVNRLLRLALEHSGIRGSDDEPLHMTAHDFRRMFATDAVTGGLPVHIAAKLLGHSSITTTQAYLAVFQDDLIKSYHRYLDNRRALRPTEEYRDPTSQEWTDFQEHFAARKLELGTCGRPYGTPCNHEHACIRCPMLRVDPQARPRLVAIIANLKERIQEARSSGWLGEVEGLQTSLNAAANKLATLDRSHHQFLPQPVCIQTTRGT